MRILALLLFVFLLSCNAGVDPSTKVVNSKANPTALTINYPKTTKDSSVVDDYHGKKIADPFRWLEDDNAPETVEWVRQQNEATYSYLDEIPFRSTIENRLAKLWNYERVTAPFKEGDAYYYFKNDGLQNQSILYTKSGIDAENETVALDPNKFSDDGTSALAGTSFSNDGKYMAYQVSEGGSDWHTAYIKDMETGEVLDDKIEWIKFSGISWSGDGFFYSRYPEPSSDAKLSGRNEFHQVFYHKIGTAQKDDELIFADRNNPNYGFFANTSHDERFLTVSIWESTSGNQFYYRDLTSSRSNFTPIFDEFGYDFNFVDSNDDDLLILTNFEAPNKRLLIIDADRPEQKDWYSLIPESDDVLQSVNILGGKIVATYIHNASSLVKVFNFKGEEIGQVELPEIGTVLGFSGSRDEQQAFYTFASFTRPETVYRLDMETLESEVYQAPTIDFDSDKYETKQVWYTSKDGTKVPMFISHKKGLNLDGKRPTLLYGYGGFDISILPRFTTTRLAMAPIMMENDGIFAVANIRGGGEFGSEWHKAGTKEQKQNVFDDFIAAAEYLTTENYTSSEKLAIYGRSNGGLLVGACMTQRPDLYKVALPAVGVLDMLRYQNFTIGRAWASDYGLSESEEGFDYLSAYSPLHNVKKTAYPATMVTTADHDDRVVPAHSFKFAAELQDKHTGEAPILIRIETSAGHGAGKSTTKKIEEAADLLSFMFFHFGEEIN